MSASPRSLPGTPPRSLILDVYGAYVRAMGGWIAVADLLSLLGALGQDAAAVRSSISRMKRAGILRAETRRGSAGYALTEQAVAILDDGDQRIFHSTTPADLAEGWVLAVFSFPEERRDQRHQLRSRLVWLGFGQLAPGVWMAPHRLLGEAQRLLRRTGLAGYVSLFEARHVGFEELSELVARTWDLDQLEALYSDFLAAHGGVLRSWRDGTPHTDREAFVAYTLALSAWRRLPYMDPGLPFDLLPAGWAGERARRLFTDIHARLQGRAMGHVRSVAGRRPHAAASLSATSPAAAR